MYAVQVRFDDELLMLPRRFRTLHAADRAVSDFLDRYGISRDAHPFRIVIVGGQSGELQASPTDPTDALTIDA